MNSTSPFMLTEIIPTSGIQTKLMTVLTWVKSVYLDSGSPVSPEHFVVKAVKFQPLMVRSCEHV